MLLLIHQKKPINNARKSTKRLADGTCSALVKLLVKDTKGQLARSGKTLRPGFEGGQIPFFQRIPKEDFTTLPKKIRPS
ncbi:uL15 family ribosomal protein [Areca yellow leaf disease phytoplasma]|uniref:uL15 family ribosomal protein n=1 Tax=Areca yellow leaf disease phytoplasma TaxID=927614 RepID=UPI0035B4FDB9